MSTTTGDSLGASSLFANQPWMSIVVPLAVVLGVGVLAVCFTVVRRRRIKHQIEDMRPGAVGPTRAMYLDAHGHEAMERELEARIVRGYRTSGTADPRAAAMGGRRARTTSRWVRANNRAFGRREEGLNELGEAPPPYEGRTGSAHKDETAVEMENLGSTRETDTRVSHGAMGGQEAQTGAISPPAYSTALTTVAETGQAVVPTPPPVVLPRERMNHLYG